MRYLLGVDLGTSSVKVVLVDELGNLIDEESCAYPIYHDQAGFSEQNPDDWVTKTIEAISLLSKRNNKTITALSFSGQMHGLVLCNKDGIPLRRAILWNDVRTTKQCEKITNVLGEQLLKVAKNKALEGFTLPKILWVQEHEPEVFKETYKFLLPKDYVRFKLSGNVAIDYSDAAGTLLLDVKNHKWADEFFEKLNIPKDIAPDLVSPSEVVGTLLPHIAKQCFLDANVKVIAGGADNACGAIAAGITNNTKVMVSIGTSGVVLQYEEKFKEDANTALHFFNHGKENTFYSMGVTLAAGYSLEWFKKTFYPDTKIEQILFDAEQSAVGSNGLLFAPYLAGERVPYADANIKGSFIGISTLSIRSDFARAVIEGITFSLKDCLNLMHDNSDSRCIVSIGGGAKSDLWIQMQANIFNMPIVRTFSTGGCGIGAAILAAVGSGVYKTVDKAVDVFVKYSQPVMPQQEEVEKYQKIYQKYQKVYLNTKNIID